MVNINHLQKAKELVPGCKVILRPRQVNDAARLLTEERLAVHNDRPLSARESVVKRENNIGESKSKEAPTGKQSPS